MRKVYTISGKCPACENTLKITRLECDKCGTVIEGDFEIGRFSRLEREQLNFIEAFIRCRGSIKLMEKEMNLSYPTIKNRLDEIISVMALETPKALTERSQENDAERMSILEKLEKGEISAEEATALLKG